MKYLISLNSCRKNKNVIKTNQNYSHYFCKRWKLNYSRKNVVEAFLPFCQQVKLKRNQPEKLLNVKLKASDNLFVFQYKHNLVFSVVNLYHSTFPWTTSFTAFVTDRKGTQNFICNKSCRFFHVGSLNRDTYNKNCVFQRNFSLNLGTHQVCLWYNYMSSAVLETKFTTASFLRTFLEFYS